MTQEGLQHDWPCLHPCVVLIDCLLRGKIRNQITNQKKLHESKLILSLIDSQLIDKQQSSSSRAVVSSTFQPKRKLLKSRDSRLTSSSFSCTSLIGILLHFVGFSSRLVCDVCCSSFLSFVFFFGFFSLVCEDLRSYINKENFNANHRALFMANFHFSVRSNLVLDSGPIDIRQKTFENEALFLWLGLTSTLNRHENGAFLKTIKS